MSLHPFFPLFKRGWNVYVVIFKCLCRAIEFFFLFEIKSAGIGTLNLLLQLSFQWVRVFAYRKEKKYIH